MATKIRMRTDRLENWEEVNPNLIKGELVITTFERVFKDRQANRAQIIIGGDNIPWSNSRRLNTKSANALIDCGDLAIETMDSMKHIKD